MQQSTIARSISCHGLGLHRGERVQLVLTPGAVDTGIVFVRPAAGTHGQDVEIPARIDSVRSASRATTLGRWDPVSIRQSEGVASQRTRAEVSTVEHLLATFYALELDNVRVEVSGSEIPVFDGSATPLLEWVRGAGRVEQAASRREFAVIGSYELREGDRFIRVAPGSGLQIDYSIDFPHPCIGRQRFALPRLDARSFASEIAPARTFGFADEVEALREAGLARGADFDNTLVLDDEKLLGGQRLRWPDEFVRHKILDLIGDLALFGAVLHAQVEVGKGGHALHHRLVRALLAGPDWLEDRTPAGATAQLA